MDLNLPNFGDSRHYCQHKIIRVLTGVVAKISTAGIKQEAGSNTKPQSQARDNVKGRAGRETLSPYIERGL